MRRAGLEAFRLDGVIDNYIAPEAAGTMLDPNMGTEAGSVKRTRGRTRLVSG